MPRAPPPRWRLYTAQRKRVAGDLDLWPMGLPACW